MKEVREITRNPCEEPWEGMKPIEEGRHCGVCDTKVFDLTNLSDSEIEEYKGKGYCVQMTENQVDDYRFVHPLKRFAAAALFVFGSSLFTVSYAQESDATAIELAESCTVKGKIKRKGGDSVIANQTVFFDIDGKRYTTTTDEEGDFTIQLPKNPRVSMSMHHTSKRKHFSTKEKESKNLGTTKFKILRIRGKF